MKPEYLTALSVVFDNPAKATALLEDMNYPRDRVPPWDTTSRAWWSRVVREIDDGITEGGFAVLFSYASRQYPGNRPFREAMLDYPQSPAPAAEAVPGPGFPPPPPLGSSGAAAQQPSPPPKADLGGPQVAPHSDEWPTITLIGSDRSDDFIREVRRHDPSAQLCYATQGQACVALSFTGVRAQEVADQVGAEVNRWNEDTEGDRGNERADVEYAVYPFRPYALREITVYGPDGEGFLLHGVPSTTPVRDIPWAVLQRYADDAVRDRRGRFLRTTVDLIEPDGTARRLNPDETLHAARVPDGAHLRIHPEATAGAHPSSYREMVLGAQRQIERYAERNKDWFRIVEIRHRELPTRYLIEFDAAGFAPPERIDDTPAELLKPHPVDVHRVSIELLREFPVRPPWVVWRTPIFHPNILRLPPGDARAGAVCLGALMDAYRPDLDLGDLCQMLVNIAAYRNYEVLRPDELGGEGYLDKVAAQWARSPEGQRQIEERGGTPRTDLTGSDQPDIRRRPLEISTWDT
ncbi:Ubiquitin-conjugating enzyme [Sinosporangium album]|uniref:Ubiquitin-conjugating enzyme n=1 Tax=Sinosporangium album TaxID=504805 RepID=A0A1G7X3W7_9ACTN|nr:effector-associated domain EAD1-containing protein [Sinosporangium album]SDG78862.1 Ubiquitin-conjugating enzyme [Sinosporangium album]